MDTFKKPFAPSAKGKAMNSPSSSSTKRRKSGDDGGNLSAKKKAKMSPDEELYLDLPGMLSEEHHIDLDVSMNISRLLEDDHKVAFIARYRKAQTHDMDPEKLKQVADSYHYLIDLQSSVGKAFKQLKREEKVTPDLCQALVSVSKKAQLETIMEPYKKGPRTTLATRAREAGLESSAIELLNGTARCQPSSLIRPGETGRDTLEQVQTGLGHIVCDLIHKDADVQREVVALGSHPDIQLVSTRKVAKSDAAKSPPKDLNKFRNYFNFRKPVRYVRGYEYLAMCRAEDKKLVTVKLELPDELRRKFTHICQRKFLSSGCNDPYRRSVVERCIGDVFTKQVSRLLERQARSSLKEKSETGALQVMARNLKAKLMTPPIRGRTILALDPGFNACKLAVVSPQGGIIYTGVVQPRLMSVRVDASSALSDPASAVLRDLVNRHGVTLIGIGNGQAVRETWRYLSTLNATRDYFRGSPLDVSLVDEGGVSEYSATKTAADEMPDLDCTVRSAVSLARRLQDPISEYVKVDVTSLGVGMYQKDMPAARVASVLGEAVEESVGAVGVDVNTASLQLLRRVPGLNAARAQNIIDKRTTHGAFVNRSQLREVKGLGPKSYEQCAGFVRILPETVNTADKVIKTITPKRKTKKATKQAAAACLEPLDQTIVHPESYPIARQLIKLAGCATDTPIGSAGMTSSVTSLISSEQPQQLADKLSTDVYTLKLIGKSLSDPRRDERDERMAPMFFKAMMRAQDVRPGAVVQGVVRNPTDFGAFVDLGVGENGLIHHSMMRSVGELRVNDQVEVEIIKVEDRKYKTDIGLRLIRVLSAI